MCTCTSTCMCTGSSQPALLSGDEDDDDETTMTSSQPHMADVNEDLEETHSDIEMSMSSPPPGG